MKEVQIDDIVEEFANNAVFLTNWNFFHRSLIPNSQDQLTSLEKRLSRNDITYKQLILEMLDLWISKNGKGATLSNLINILVAREHQDLADNLTEKYTTENSATEEDKLLIRFVSKRKLTEHSKKISDKLVSKTSVLTKIFISCIFLGILIYASRLYKMRDQIAGSGNKSNDATVIDEKSIIVWDMQNPSAGFKGRENDIKTFLEYLNRYQATPELTALLILGPPLVGKTQLASKIAKQLYLERDFNCIQIDGSNIVLDIERINNLYTIDINSSNMYDKAKQWLLTFDGVDDVQSRMQLGSLFKTWTRLTPNFLTPFIVVTSRTETLHYWIPNLFNYAKVKTHHLPTYGSLTNVFNETLTSWIYEDKDLHNIPITLNVTRYINNAISNLDHSGDINETTVAVTFSFLGLLSHLTLSTVEQNIFLQFWNLALNQTVETVLLRQVLSSFIGDKIILAGEDGKIFYPFFEQKEFKLIMKRYLSHDGIKSIMLNLFNIDVSYNGVSKWLIHTAIEHFKISSGNSASLTDKLFQQLLDQDYLIMEFKEQFPKILHLFNIQQLEVVEEAFTKYNTVFGKTDEVTLEIGCILSNLYENFKMEKKCGILSKRLFDIQKNIHGYETDITLKHAFKALKYLKRKAVDDGAYEIAIEVYDNCNRSNSSVCKDILANETWSFYLDAAKDRIPINRTHFY